MCQHSTIVSRINTSPDNEALSSTHSNSDSILNGDDQFAVELLLAASECGVPEAITDAALAARPKNSALILIAAPAAAPNPNHRTCRCGCGRVATYFSKRTGCFYTSVACEQEYMAELAERNARASKQTRSGAQVQADALAVGFGQMPPRYAAYGVS